MSLTPSAALLARSRRLPILGFIARPSVAPRASRHFAAARRGNAFNQMPPPSARASYGGKVPARASYGSEVPARASYGGKVPARASYGGKVPARAAEYSVQPAARKLVRRRRRSALTRFLRRQSAGTRFLRPQSAGTRFRLWHAALLLAVAGTALILAILALRRPRPIRHAVGARALRHHAGRRAGHPGRRCHAHARPRRARLTHRRR